MTCIVMTGTIAPSLDVKDLSINNPTERYKQYIQNICKYITETKVENIVFCENSQYPIPDIASLLSLAKMYGKKLEIIQFLGNVEKTVALGRGYGEQEILEYAITHSTLLSTEQSFYKITGRYRVNNIDTILEDHIRNANVFSLISPIDRRCSTAFFKCNIKFFMTHLSKCGDEVDDNLGKSYQLEGIYTNRLHSVKHHISGFKTLPIFTAYTGSGYLLKPNIAKDTVKQILNLLGLYSL